MAQPIPIDLLKRLRAETFRIPRPAFVLTALLLLASVLPGVPARAAAPEPREARLANGIRVLLAPDPEAASVDVATWHFAGSGRETAAQSGASFLLERLALSGAWSPAARRALQAVEAAGGTHGSFTTPDYSSFHETLPPEALGAALRLEAARLAPPELTDALLSRERRAAREALARIGDGGPVGRALQMLYSEVFGAHAYARQVTGDPAARDAMTAVALRGYAAARYAAPSSRITIVGRFDPDSALAAVRRAAGTATRRSASLAPAAAPAVQTTPQRVVVASEGRYPMLAAAWRLPGATDSARVVFPILARLLMQGPGSHLVRDLVVQPGAPCLRLEGSVAEREQATLLYFVAALRENADSAAVEAAVLDAAGRIGREPIAAEDFERARREVELEQRLERQTARGRAQALGSSWMETGDWRAADRDLERLASLTAEDVRAVAARVLTQPAFTAVWIMPGAAGGSSR